MENNVSESDTYTLASYLDLLVVGYLASKLSYSVFHMELSLILRVKKSVFFISCKMFLLCAFYDFILSVEKTLIYIFSFARTIRKIKKGTKPLAKLYLQPPKDIFRKTNTR